MSSLDLLVLAQSREAGWPDPQREYRFATPRKWRTDYYWHRAAGHVALEIEGGVWTNGRHTRGAGFMRDLEKYNELAVRGITLIRLTPSQVCSGELTGWLRRAA